MDVAAKLGIIVDAQGARREIKLTSDELAHLSNGGTEATAVMKGLSGGMTEAAAQAEAARSKISPLADSIARMRAAAANRLDLGLSKQIAELDPFRLRTEQGTMATTKLATSMEKMRAASREKVDLGLASQIAQLDPFQKGLGQVAERGLLARLSTGRFANSLVDLGAHLTGVHPLIGKLVEILGSLSIGGIVTIGVVAGIAAISYAWSKFTEDVRKATAEQNKLVDDSMKNLQRRSLGAGGEFADIATAAAGRISDLQQQRREQVENPFTRELLPGRREEMARGIDSEISRLRLLMKDSERSLDLARAKAFADSITAPFDYAVQRGQSILGFYESAIVAQRELNELAKSGNHETKQAAIQGLQQIQQIIDRIALQRMGLADRPSTLLGLPTQTTTAGIGQTTANLQAAIQSGAAHGRGIDEFEDQIQRVYKTVVEAGDEIRSSHMPESVRTAVQAYEDQLLLLGQAQRMAAAKTAEDRETIARQIRNLPGLQRTGDAGVLPNVQAQQQYGEALAAREAALKLPAVFDADREHVVRHGEAMRSSKNEIELNLKSFSSLSGVMDLLKEGALAAADALTMGLAQLVGKGLLGGVTDTLLNGVHSLIDKGSEGIRHALFGSTSEQRAAAAAQRDAQKSLKLTLDSLRAGVKGDTLAQQIDAARQSLIGLLKSINDAFPGTKNEGERNRQRAEAQALEAQQEQQLREADAQRRREATEDLRVRLLRAQGQDAEADALALANTQQREYNQAVKDGADAAYLAMLTQVQAAEKIKAAMDSLQDSVRNAPTGFRPEDYGLGLVMPPGGGYPLGPPRPTPLGANPFQPSDIPASMMPNSTTMIAPVYVTISEGGIVIDGRENPDTIAQKAVNGFRRFAASAVGPNAPLAAAIELMPTQATFH